jgi:hypothetical protein
MRNGTAEASQQSSTVEESQRKAARAAGLAFLISFALLAYGEFGIRRSLLSGDPILGLVNAAETSRNILAQPSLFRLNIVLIRNCSAPLFWLSRGRRGWPTLRPS